LPVEFRWLGDPIILGYRLLRGHHEGRGAKPRRGGKIGLLQLLEADLIHGLESQLSLLETALYKPSQPYPHLLEAGAQSGLERLVKQCRSNELRDQLVEIGDTFKSISNRLIIEIGVFVYEPLAKTLIDVELSSKDRHAHDAARVKIQLSWVQNTLLRGECQLNDRPMISPSQIRMARAALGWSVRELAKRAGVAANTVSRFENGSGAMVDTLARMQQALEAAGVVFIPADHTGGAGVRLREATASKAKRKRSR
jgi:DNA-binding XRE family transcriptional regulator